MHKLFTKLLHLPLQTPQLLSMATNNIPKDLIISFIFLSLILVQQAHSISTQETGTTSVSKQGSPTIDCNAACNGRCRLSSRPNLCKRACGTCCYRCNCVPPGTSGNHQMCPCYANITTRGNKRKCP